MLEKIQVVLGLIVAGVLAVLGALSVGKRRGKKEAEAEADRDILENVEKAKHEEDKVGALSDDDVNARLRDKWTR